MLTCYLSQWIALQNLHAAPRTANGGRAKDDSVLNMNSSANSALSRFGLGYERFEVLAVFSSCLLAQLGGMFVIKEAAERMVDPPEIHL